MTTKKILVVTARRFNPREFWGVLKPLQQNGYQCDVVGLVDVVWSEDESPSYALEHTVYDVDSLEDYVGIVFISGNPEDTEALWHDEKCRELAREAGAQELVIGAVCSAVPAIRDAADGYKVSVYPLQRSLFLLRMAGAEPVEVSLQTDRNIVTAENEQMTEMWVENFLDVLEGRPPTHVLEKSPFEHRTYERPAIPELERIKEVKNKTGKTQFPETVP